MIGYVTLGTNDLEKSKAFYNAVLPLLGAAPGHSNDRMQFFAVPNGPMLAICKPYDGNTATAGNGTMISLVAPSHAVVEEVYKKALEAGAADEGAPGERIPGFYGAYFRDPDGNKLCVFKMG